MRAAVLGCGAISQEHLAFLATSELAEPVAVVDRSPTAVRHAQLRFGVPAGYTDVDEMLAAVRPDVVHVLTPPASHLDLATRSLAAGAHVLCEKPIVLRADDLETIDRAAGAAGRRYMENHNYLRNDEVLHLDRVLREGRVGDVVDVDISFCVPMPDSALGAPGGAVHDYLTHVSYLALHFLGEGELDHVSSVWGRLGDDPRVGFDEMTAVVRVGRRTATIRVSGTAKPMENRLTVAGTAGRASVELFQGERRLDVDDPTDPLRPLIGRVAAGAELILGTAGSLRNKLLQKSAIHGLPRLLSDFYAALAASEELPVTSRDIERTSRLIDRLVAGAR